MKNFTREFLVDQYGGDEILITKLTIGYRYRIEFEGQIVHSGVMSFEEDEEIFKLGKRIQKHTERGEDVDKLEDELEELKELKEEKKRLEEEEALDNKEEPEVEEDLIYNDEDE